MTDDTPAGLQPAPVRVCRVGGAVRAFATPRLIWKKGHRVGGGECLIKLALPAGERLVYPARPAHNWNGNKLRAEAVRVLALESAAGDRLSDDTVIAPHRRDFEYPVGERVEPDDFSPETTATSAPGIHCYATRAGARHWGDPAHAKPVAGDD